MPVELSGRLIFLASPGNMAKEREACRMVVREFNEKSSESEQVVFLLRAWEDMPGGVGRPQDRINPKLDECDYMILILGDRWGSPPAVKGPYSSGTEEEFYRCLDLLASPTAVMRDLLVVFRTLEPERLRDPGPQLLEVMNFRNDLEEAKSLQFVSFDSEQSFEAAIRKQLAEWARPLSEREPVKIDLPKLRTIEAGATVASHIKLLEAAKEHAKSGLLMQAELLFAQAIEDGDVEAVAEFALFMRRTGRLDTALELNQKIIEDPGVLSSTDHDSVARRVRALVNMGIIHRKRSSLTESIKVLREAVRTAESSVTPVYQELCYALDNYGLSLLRVGELDLARQQFEKTYSVRKEFGTSLELAQSAINLARQSLVSEDFAHATTLFEEALGILETENDGHCLANALCGLAEARLRAGVRDGVRALLERALEVNETLGNSDGTSIAHALLAKYFLAEGDVGLARGHAELCREESERTNSATGYGTSYLLKAMIARQEGDGRAAAEDLAKAQQYAQSSGNEPLVRDIDAVRREWAAAPATEAPTEPTPDSARTSK
ncbi:DUF4062 domain-containing protein [Amycolatopsis sp. NPDC051371]|uniref:DUF4062 domain-containing protein n=1 Tax=Amycolatopsis sp. NPDC051371 TaxID=3155800 RepID=UPI00343916AC